MADKVQSIIEEIKSLSLLEASQLVKGLEEAFGVSAAAATVAVAAGPAAGGGAADLAGVERDRADELGGSERTAADQGEQGRRNGRDEALDLAFERVDHAEEIPRVRAVEIEVDKSATRFDILTGPVPEKRTLPAAGFPENHDMHRSARIAESDMLPSYLAV